MKEARRERGLSQASLAKKLGVGQSTIASIENDRNSSSAYLVQIANALLVSPTWLATGKGEKRPPGPAQLNGPVETMLAIPVLESRGCCGGAPHPVSAVMISEIYKTAAFFSRIGVSPENSVAIFADGDGMADFIVHGDIVVFDTTDTVPATGKIMLIQHPEGPRVRQLRRDFDGGWVLESRNLDKRRHPDERVSAVTMNDIVFIGSFAYREGFVLP